MALGGQNKYVNFYRTFLAEDIDPANFLIKVISADGLPSVTGGDYFYLTLTDVFFPSSFEIVKCTKVDGTTLTVERGTDDTTAKSFLKGDRVEGQFVAGNLDDLQTDWDVAEAGLSALIDANNDSNTDQAAEIALLTVRVSANTAEVIANAAAITGESARIDNLDLGDLANLTADGIAAFQVVQGDGVSTADPIAVLNDTLATPGVLLHKFPITTPPGINPFNFNVPVSGFYRIVVDGQIASDATAQARQAYCRIFVYSGAREVFTDEYSQFFGLAGNNGTSGNWPFKFMIEVQLDAGGASIILPLSTEVAGLSAEWNPASAPDSVSNIFIYLAEVIEE